MIQFLLPGLIPVGIVILVFSIKLVKKTFSGDVILEVPYALKSAEFILDKPGTYSIWHQGPFFTKAPLDEFRPEITDQSTGIPVKLSSRLFRPNANNGRSARMEIFRFSVPPGTYRLELKEGSSISKAEQRVIDAIPAGKVDKDKYFIQVRESQPFLLSLSGIAGIALGGFCIVGGLVSGILSFTGS
jgi:hypothetical protein